MEDKLKVLHERIKDLQRDLINNCRNEYAVLLNKNEVEILLQLFEKNNS